MINCCHAFENAIGEACRAPARHKFIGAGQQGRAGWGPSGKCAGHSCVRQIAPIILQPASAQPERPPLPPAAPEQRIPACSSAILTMAVAQARMAVPAAALQQQQQRHAAAWSAPRAAPHAAAAQVQQRAAAAAAARPAAARPAAARGQRRQHLAVAAAAAPAAVESLTIQPVRVVEGHVKLPGSKSLSNRILLLAALAEGTTTVENILVRWGASGRTDWLAIFACLC